MTRCHADLLVVLELLVVRCGTVGESTREPANNFTARVVHLSQNVRKRALWHVRPMKTQISLRIRAVWLESSLPTWRNFASLDIQNAFNEYSVQTARIFPGRRCPKVHFLRCGSFYRRFCFYPGTLGLKSFTNIAWKQHKVLHSLYAAKSLFYRLILLTNRL